METLFTDPFSLLMGCEPLVDLFGKKKLDDRIMELEARLSEAQKEKEDFLSTLDKREEKIKKLTSSLQEANVALKAAEKKISSAQSSKVELEKSDGQTPSGINLGPREFERLIKRLSLMKSPEDDLLAAYAGNAESLPSGLPSEAKKIIYAQSFERGFAVMHFPQLFTLVLKPPLPVAVDSFNLGNAFDLEPLMEMMETPVLVISAHAGDTFLGVALNKDGFEVQEFVSSQVKEKHSKGGWSQKRFERLRDEDIKKHIEDVIDKLTEIKRKYGSIVKFAVLGGDPVILKQIAPTVGLPLVERRLEKHDEKRLDRLRDVVYGFTYYRA
jgi:hypothetical protein